MRLNPRATDDQPIRNADCVLTIIDKFCNAVFHRAIKSATGAIIMLLPGIAASYD